MPTYISRVGETYKTDQYDIWDIISIRCYGVEHCMHHLIDANYEYVDQGFFPANVVSKVPLRVETEFDLKPRIHIDVKRLLPWR